VIFFVIFFVIFWEFFLSHIFTKNRKKLFVEVLGELRRGMFDLPTEQIVTPAVTPLATPYRTPRPTPSLTPHQTPSVGNEDQPLIGGERRRLALMGFGVRGK
jgi:hypothetical protein